MFSKRIALTFILFLTIAPATRAAFPTTQPYPGVRYSHETRKDPAMSLYVVQLDLANPAVNIRVSPAGPDPDGDGPWQTVLMPPSEIAAREKFDVCINASFFDAQNTKDAEGAKSGYVAGKWASAVGIAMTDGNLWSANVSSRVARHSGSMRTITHIWRRSIRSRPMQNRPCRDTFSC